MGETRRDDFAEILTPEALAPVKKSVELAGHPTSVTLEPVFWRELARIARTRGLSMNALVTKIDAAREGAQGTLAGALRLYVLNKLGG